MSVDDYFAVTSQYHEMVTMTNGGTITIGTAIAPQALTPMPPDHCVMPTLRDSARALVVSTIHYGHQPYRK